MYLWTNLIETKFNIADDLAPYINCIMIGESSDDNSHTNIPLYADWLKKTEIPKLCLYVTPGVGFQSEDLKVVENEFKNTKLIYLGEGGHFIQEDYPHEIGEEISN